MDEIQIIEHIKKGDEFIYKYVYDKYVRLIFDICYKMAGSKEEAEDASQEVFIKVFNSIGTFKSNSKLSTWIYRITVNICINLQRRKKIVKFLSFNFWDEEKETTLNNETPLNSIEKLEIQNIVQNALNRLPVKQKTALILSRYEDKSYREIAEILGTSLPAVESLIFRAKVNLAKNLSLLKNK